MKVDSLHKMVRDSRVLFAAVLYQVLIYVNMHLVDCDFEDKPCGWKNTTLGTVFRVNGSSNAWRAYGNENGHFLVVGESSTLRYESTCFYNEDVQCLRLRYLVIGSLDASISVSLQVEGKTYQSLRIFNISFEGRNTWIRANSEIRVMNTVMVKIYLIGRTGSHTNLALDDIAITPGSCQETRSTTTTFSTMPATATTTISYRKTVTNLNDSTSVSTGTIIGMVIGCLTLTITVSVVAFYIYRRSAQRALSKTLQSNTVANGIYSTVSTKENNSQNIKCSTRGRNSTGKTVHYNTQAQCTTVEERRPLQSQKPHIPGQGNTKLYSLTDRSGRDVTSHGQSRGLRHHGDNSEGNNPYDITYDTNETVPHSIYNLTNKIRDDTYDSTIPSVKMTSDETYKHTNFNITSDNTYDCTYCTHENFPNQDDSNPTYDYTCNAGDQDAYEITNTIRNTV